MYHIRKARMVAALLLVTLIGSFTPIYAAYKSVRPWDVMPESIVSWASQTGLKEAYDAQRWSEFRGLADELIGQPGLSTDRALYLRLLIARSGADRDPISDPAELALRVKYLNEAEELALLAPADHHQALGFVYHDLAIFNQAGRDSAEELRAWKKLVEQYYDVRFAAGAPEYWPTLTNTYDMPDLFAAAGESPEHAVAYLQGLVRRHPVREFRFMALLTLGRQYALLDDLNGVGSVVREADRDFADLTSVPEFEVNLAGLRLIAKGKGHATPAPRGGSCCEGKH